MYKTASDLKHLKPHTAIVGSLMEDLVRLRETLPGKSKNAAILNGSRHVLEQCFGTTMTSEW